MRPYWTLGGDVLCGRLVTPPVASTHLFLVHSMLQVNDRVKDLVSSLYYPCHRHLTTVDGTIRGTSADFSQNLISGGTDCITYPPWMDPRSLLLVCGRLVVQLAQHMGAFFPCISGLETTEYTANTRCSQPYYKCALIPFDPIVCGFGRHIYDAACNIQHRRLQKE